MAGKLNYVAHVWSTFGIGRWVKAMGDSVVGGRLMAGRAAPLAKFNVQQQSSGSGGGNNDNMWHWAVITMLYLLTSSPECQQRATLAKECIATQQIQMTQHNRVGAMAAGIMIGSWDPIKLVISLCTWPESSRRLDTWNDSVLAVYCAMPPLLPLLGQLFTFAIVETLVTCIVMVVPLLVIFGVFVCLASHASVSVNMMGCPHI